MELRQLSYFLKVYEEKNITKAAQKIHLSQQALSHSLNNLEKEWGHALFVRNSSGLVPTEFATYMLPFVKQVLEDSEKIKWMAEQYSQPTSKLSLIIANNLIGNPDMGLVNGIMDWGIENHVEIDLIESDCEHAIHQVISGEADGCLVYSQVSHPNLEKSTIDCGSCCIVMSKKNLLAEKEKLFLEDLKGQTMIYCKTVDWRKLEFIQEIYRRAIPIRVITPVNQAGTMWEMIRNNAGITGNYTPFTKSMNLEGMIVKQLQDYNDSSQLSFAWNKGAKDKQEQLCEIYSLIKQYYESFM